MALELVLNGQTRNLADLDAGCSLESLLAHLGFQADRVAVERNGELAPRRTWPNLAIDAGDKLEVVHFVGGGHGAVS